MPFSDGGWDELRPQIAQISQIEMPFSDKGWKEPDQGFACIGSSATGIHL
jgi:hypothetical protein